MKAFFRKVNDIAPWVVVIAGLPLAVYGAVFQSENFKWIPALYCLYLAIVTFAGAYFMMSYLEEQAVSGKAGPLSIRKGMRSVVQGTWISFFIGLLVLYRCVSRLGFYLGLFVMLFSWSCLVFHFILSKHYRKKAEEKKP
ncbi:MAG: hypothetical protein J6Z38_06475 [Lachnospiraceae bacterium]|nr:hypothetical protein [Lachnospiraceae bacterium]